MVNKISEEKRQKVIEAMMEAYMQPIIEAMISGVSIYDTNRWPDVADAAITALLESGEVVVNTCSRKGCSNTRSVGGNMCHECSRKPLNTIETHDDFIVIDLTTPKPEQEKE